MSNNQWITLYDASRAAPSGLLFPLVGLALVAIGIVGVRLKHFGLEEGGHSRVVRGSTRARRFLWFAVAWTGLSVALTIVPHVRLIRALRAQRYQVVEGLVEDYVAADLMRKTPERWTVAGRRYKFYDSRVRSGLSSPGVVQPGMVVRIADVDGAIARLEVNR